MTIIQINVTKKGKEDGPAVVTEQRKRFVHVVCINL